MPPSPPTFLGLLRRHLRVVAMLFVCLVMTKTGFASVCATDQFAGMSASAVATVVDVHAGETQAAASGDPGADSCWHSGAGGCHCVCVHAMPLSPQASVVHALKATSLRFDPVLAAFRLAPRDDHLRPPIA